MSELRHYRMHGSNEYEASRVFMQALAGKTDEECARLVARVIDSAYRSQADMDRLRQIITE